MTETQELRTSVVWETSGVDRGLQRVERALDRMDASEQKAADAHRAREARAAQRAGEQQIKAREAALREIEKDEKESLDRRVKMTDQALERMNRAERKRIGEARQAISIGRIGQGMSSAGGGSPGRAGGGGHGGGSGSHGGFIGSARARWIGDALDMTTGTNGWVRRTMGLDMAGSALARMGMGGGVALSGIGGVAAGGIELFRQSRQAALDQQESHAGFAAAAPRLTAQVRGGFTRESLAGSREGIEEQSQKIATQESRLREDNFGMASPFKKLGMRFGSLWNHPFQSPRDALDTERRTNRLEGGVLRATERLRSSRYGAAAGAERDVARAGYDGDPFAAQRTELGQRKREEEAGEEYKRSSEASKKATQERYEFLGKTIDREERMAAITALRAQGEERIAGRTLAGEERTQALLTERLKTTKAILEYEHLTVAERREYTQELLSTQNAQRDLQRSLNLQRTQGGIDLAASRFAIGQDTTSPNQQLRFAAGQSVARNDAAANVASAQANFDATRSVASQNALNQAKLAQLDVEKKLSAEARARQRMLATTARAASLETAAMRVANTGRTDRADVMRERAQSAAAQLEYRRQGRDDLAGEEQEQQGQREIGRFDEKYLRPDGRKRSRTAINREERAARKLGHRRDRRHRELDRNEGLIDVHRGMGGEVLSGRDPLTREKLSPEQMYARRDAPRQQAAAEATSEATYLKGILEIMKATPPVKLVK